MSVYIEDYTPVVQQFGLNTQKATVLESTLAVTGATTLASTLAVTGASTFTGAITANGGIAGPAFPRTVTNSALVGATVVLTAAQSGQTFNNRATSGTPSWTLPTAANGLWYTFTVSNVTAGFTITGGTIVAKTNAAGTAITGTTLTNTQASAVVGDTITLVCDGTSWRMVSQSGIFAAT